MPVPLWQPDIARKKKAPKETYTDCTHTSQECICIQSFLNKLLKRQTAHSSGNLNGAWHHECVPCHTPSAATEHLRIFTALTSSCFQHIFCFCCVLSNRELTSDGVLHKSVAKTEVWIKGNKRQTNQTLKDMCTDADFTVTAVAHRHVFDHDLVTACACGNSHDKQTTALILWWETVWLPNFLLVTSKCRHQFLEGNFFFLASISSKAWGVSDTRGEKRKIQIQMHSTKMPHYTCQTPETHTGGCRVDFVLAWGMSWQNSLC